MTPTEALEVLDDCYFQRYGGEPGDVAKMREVLREVVTEHQEFRAKLEEVAYDSCEAAMACYAWGTVGLVKPAEDYLKLAAEIDELLEE